MDGTISKEYGEFLKNNRIKVNKYLNVVLWFFLITGPAIAVGVKIGIFPDIGYDTCIAITAGVVILASIHLALFKKMPSSNITCVYALVALDLLIVYMSYSHVSIYLTWFLVPMISMLYCSTRMFYFAVVTNYVLMFITTWLNSSYYAASDLLHPTPMAYFADRMSGFTIETVIMFSAGYALVKLALGYYRTLFSQNNQIIANEENLKNQIAIQESMTEIYDYVNLIDFVNSTEMSLRDPEQKKYIIDMSSQKQTRMNQKINEKVMPSQLGDFMDFTNITTVRTRLTGKKLISAEFIDVESGWFCAQYITVDAGIDGIPNTVIYTIRNVDEEKRREENLIMISMTDEMTKLYNRRCFDEDLDTLRTGGMDADLVLFSSDVNGLKKVNDTKGHAAGDELIIAAADCLAKSVGNMGKVYRTGGDEFMAIIHTDSPEALRAEIIRRTSQWHGTYNDEVTLSVGYASCKDHPGASVDELERFADTDMYSEKEKYYKESGHDRRR